MTGGRGRLVAQALEQFHSAVVDGELTHDGSLVLTPHVLNARRRTTSGHLHIGKSHPDSPNKIDAAVAAVLAWQARLDALAKGVGTEKPASKKLYAF
jgi:phage terminase large subunit-like protein